MPRILIDPPLLNDFDTVFDLISNQIGQTTPNLPTTGNNEVYFQASRKVTRDGRQFISLPHNNRIYENDWGFQSNSMGKLDKELDNIRCR